MIMMILKHFYSVGFPKEKDYGYNSDESSIIENSYTPIFDCKTGGFVRFLDPKRIKENRQNKLIDPLKNNVNRVLPIPDYIMERI